MKQIVCGLLILIGVVLGCDQATPPNGFSQPWEGAGRHIVMFTSEHCVACQQQKAELSQLRERGIMVWEVDGDIHPELLAQYNVTQYPTYLIFEDGSLLDRVFSVRTLITMLKILKWIVMVLI